MKLYIKSMANYGEKGEGRFNPESIKNLKIAKEMKNNGEPELKIKEATGWEYLPDLGWRKYHIDGHFKFEKIRKTIDRIVTKSKEELQIYWDEFYDNKDNDVDGIYRDKFFNKKDEYDKLKIEKELNDLINQKIQSVSKMLYEVWEDESLYKAYPELKCSYVEFTFDSTTNKGGNFNDANKTFIINLGWKSLGETDMNQMEIKTTRGVFIHEIQHAIQYIEGHMFNYSEPEMPSVDDMYVLGKINYVMTEYKNKYPKDNRFDIFWTENDFSPEKFKLLMELRSISSYADYILRPLKAEDIIRIFKNSFDSITKLQFNAYSNSPWERESRAMDDMKDLPDSDKLLTKNYEIWLSKEQYPYTKIHK